MGFGPPPVSPEPLPSFDGDRAVKNKDKWKPSKYIYKNGKLIGSRDTMQVGLASRLYVDLTASFYDLYLPMYAKGRLVDLGCGQVPLFGAYKDHISDNICVDWANTIHRNEYLDHECDLTQTLPFASETFDTVILSDVLEHVPEPEHLWREMARILTRGGNALISVPFYYKLHEVPHDYYRYTDNALRRFARRAGFEMLLLAPIGGTPEILADLLAKHLQYVPVAGRALAVATQSVAGAFRNTRLGKKLSAQTGIHFPLGYFLIARRADGEASP
jgi:SAM-dependent methyltransferase